jgi:hypothetical protein
MAVTLIGFGTAGTAFGATVTASAGMADENQGLVGGVINTARQIGAAFGAALLFSIAEGDGGAGEVATVVGDRNAMLAAATTAALATIVAWHSSRMTTERESSLTLSQITRRNHSEATGAPA